MRSVRVLVLAATLCLVATVGAVSVTADSGAQETANQTVPDHIEECAAEPPEDFADPEGDTAEVIGWVEGYWYNEPLDIDAEDGLTEEELDSLSARTAARFEAMRCLTADGLPPVEIQTREELQDELAGQFAELTETERQFDNAQLKTLLTVGTDRDAVEVREANRGETIGGFYDFEANRIVVVSDSPESLLIDEQVLAHELGHAIQDQQFNLSQYERPTQDRDVGVLGLIEGDVHLIEQEYLEACENDEWNEPCVQQEFDDEPEEPDLPSWGLYFMDFQPYSDGPAFVEQIFESHGEDWSAVDELYENPPQSSAETIDPGLYGEFEPAELTVEDQSTDSWDRLTPEEGPGYDVVGQAGITAILMALPYETNEQIISPFAFLNIDEDGDPDEFNPLNYDQPETDGWIGDRLYAYEDDDDLGAVWKLAWEDNENAAQFATAYEQLAQARGGQQHSEFENVYTFEETEGWEMAAAVEVRDDRLWIVTAPTVDGLESLHDIELIESSGDAEANGDTDDADDDGPGFGPLAAVVGLLGVALVVRRTRTEQ